MPYGVDKDLGGDNPSNVSFMEKCVSGIKGTNKRTQKLYTEGEKIAICKTALKKRKSKESSLEQDAIQESIAEFSNTQETILRGILRSEKASTIEGAYAYFQKRLILTNYDTSKILE